MTQQEFYLQAAIQIAAQLHPNNRTFDDGEECNINTYAVSAASNLLKEVQTEWGNRTENANMYGALFDDDPKIKTEPKESATGNFERIDIVEDKPQTKHYLATFNVKNGKMRKLKFVALNNDEAINRSRSEFRKLWNEGVNVNSWTLWENNNQIAYGRMDND